MISSILGARSFIPSFQRLRAGQCTELVNGQYSLKGLPEKLKEVTHSTRVNGELKAEHVVFRKIMEVNGQVNCNNCIFQSDLLIAGNSNLNNCLFRGSIEVLAKNITLNKSIGNTLVVTNPIPFTAHRISTVFLRNQSHFNSIEFLGSKGRVVVSSNSAVNQVINGRTAYSTL